MLAFAVNVFIDGFGEFNHLKCGHRRPFWI